MVAILRAAASFALIAVLALAGKPKKSKGVWRPAAHGSAMVPGDHRTRLSARHNPRPKKGSHKKLRAADNDLGVMMYHKQGDCGKVSHKKHLKHLKKKSFLQKGDPELPVSMAQPGSGMEKSDIVPYDMIYKDGYYTVGCFYDHVRINKDKHSAQGSHRYKVDNSQISIVWYHETVEKEDQDLMSPKVCYDFCRTIKDMSFFGLFAGTDCYCTPYYKPGEGGEGGKCDLTCAGDPATFCGGNDKSEIYEMHLCADTAEVMEEAKAAAEEVQSDAADCAANEYAETMQNAGDALRTSSKGFGDDAAGTSGQAASVFAGDLQRVVEDCAAKEAEMTDLLADYDTHSGFELGRMSQVEAEDYTKKMQAATEDGIALAKVAKDTMNSAHPDITGIGDEAAAASAFGSYYPVYQLVNNETKYSKQSCGGTYTQKPIVDLSKEECALACNDVVYPTKERCMGYQFFEDGEGTKLCWLFSDIDRVNYYDCGEGGAAALMQGAKKVHMRAGDDLECFVNVGLVGDSWKPAGALRLKGCFSSTALFL